MLESRSSPVAHIAVSCTIRNECTSRNAWLSAAGQLHSHRQNSAWPSRFSTICATWPRYARLSLAFISSAALDSPSSRASLLTPESISSSRPVGLHVHRDITCTHLFKTGRRGVSAKVVLFIVCSSVRSNTLASWRHETSWRRNCSWSSSRNRVSTVAACNPISLRSLARRERPRQRFLKTEICTFATADKRCSSWPPSLRAMRVFTADDAFTLDCLCI
mmetsp:Transcript_24434/g.46306  ORF Transcript_24434/g.46306 Transcript_24434/m.46306 type:complete len:219 (+) Transcript_24434:5239-5895(+)